jgi:hypothetical protein
MARSIPSTGSIARFALVALLLLGLLLAKGLATPVPSIGATQAATGFDTTTAIARLTRILGDERPHPVDSPANDAVRDRLLAEIVALGYAPVVRDDFSCRGSKRWAGMSCARVRNVLFRAGPAGGGAVLVASHYDSVPAGPGAADDGAGVSAALEIAARLKGRVLQKPVIFLFTDGEEAGLLGAASFVRKDPWAPDVAFAVNMEARGTGGPAIMFQTSSPNSRDIAAFNHSKPRIIANSLAADIYRILPNDTDATEFIDKGWDVVNFAFIAPLARYHTPNDSLAYLQHESVGHMGAAALASVEGWLAAPPAAAGAPESTVIYSDVLGRGVVVLPGFLGMALLVAGFLAAGALYLRTGGTGIVRAFLAPVLAVLAGTGIGYGALWMAGTVQTEVQWWTAMPVAARLAVYGAALLGTALGLWMARGIRAPRVVAAGWLWLLGLSLGASFVSPGSMILTAPAAGVFALVALAIMIAMPRGERAQLERPQKDFPVWMAIPAIVLLVLTLPTLDFAEAGLGFGPGAAFAGLASLLAFVTWGALWGSRDTRPSGVAALVAVAVAGCAWAALAPAHSPDLPRPLNIQHWHGPGAGDHTDHWVLAPSGKQAPAPMQAVAPFVLGSMPGADGDRLHAPGPATSPQLPPPSATVLADTGLTNGTRRVQVRISAPGADEVTISVPAEAALQQSAGGAGGAGGRFELGAEGPKFFRCVGRACATWDLEVVVAAPPATWTVRAVGRGLPVEAAALQAARPGWAKPLQGGDVRIATTSIRL